MQFCTDHWTRLRELIEARGLADLIPQDAETAIMQFADATQREQLTAVNFDPLGDAHWVIVGNITRRLMGAGAHPLAVLARQGCPLCYVNELHERTCDNPRCVLDRVAGFDWMLEKAADDAREKADRLLGTAGGGT